MVKQKEQAQSDSYLLECIRLLMNDSRCNICDIAKTIGTRPTTLRYWTRDCSGEQLKKAEQVIDALGYELVLRKKGGNGRFDQPTGGD